MVSVVGVGLNVNSSGAINGQVKGTSGLFSGLLSVDSPSLVVDATNHRVGIGIATPSWPLQVQANVNNYAAAIINSNTGASAGGLAIVPGNNAAPAIAINNAANTVNQHIFFGNGSAWLAIAGGNVGIGTAGPTRTLSIQAATNQYMAFMDGATETMLIGNEGSVSPVRRFVVYDAIAAAYRLAITSAGDIGIGTVTPSALLHVSKINSNAAYDIVRIGASDYSSGTNFVKRILSLGPINVTTGFDERVDLRAIDIGDVTMTASNYLVGSQGARFYGVRIGNITGSAPVSDLVTYGFYLGSIANPSAGGVLSTNYGMYLGSVGGAGATNYSIYSAGGQMYHAGTVGIGTTTPASLFEVYNANAGSTQHPATSGSSTVNTVASFRNQRGVELDIGYQTNSPWGQWLQATGPTDHSLNYPLLLNPNGGTVGIGNLAPDALLHIGAPAFAGTTMYGNNAGAQITSFVGTQLGIVHGSVSPYVTTYPATVVIERVSNMATAGGSNNAVYIHHEKRSTVTGGIATGMLIDVVDMNGGGPIEGLKIRATAKTTFRLGQVNTLILEAWVDSGATFNAGDGAYALEASIVNLNAAKAVSVNPASPHANILIAGGLSTPAHNWDAAIYFSPFLPGGAPNYGIIVPRDAGTPITGAERANYPLVHGLIGIGGTLASVIDTRTGTITTAVIETDNNVSIAVSKDSGGTARNVIKLNGSNQIELGDASTTTYIANIMGIGMAAGSFARISLQGAANAWGAIFLGSATTGQSYGLQIQAGTNSSDIAFQVINTGGSPYLHVRGDGLVGIATTSPDELLHVAGGNAGDGAHIGNAYIGVWDSGTAYASFQHNTLKGTSTSYCLLSHDDGLQTLLNVGTGGLLYFRVGNAGGVTMSATEMLPSAPNVFTLGSTTLRFATLWTQAGTVSGSSRRFKRRIKMLNPIHALDVVRKTDFVTFRYKGLDRPEVGFIAEDAPDMLSPDHENVSPQTTASVALAAIKALLSITDQLTSRVAQLEAKLKAA